MPLLVLSLVGILAAVLFQRHRRRRDTFAAIKATTVQRLATGGGASDGSHMFPGGVGGKPGAVVVAVGGGLEEEAAVKRGDLRGSYARPHDSADSGTCRTTSHQEKTPKGLTFSEIWRQALIPPPSPQSPPYMLPKRE